nr:twitch domain-containing radical SAM protein [Oxalobacteraceae bacterium]
MQPNSNLCMAPWTHTYVSPQIERRMCCASREPAQNFRQYIDTAEGSGHFQPLTLQQHWNGEHMKSVRRRMMAGETLSECQVCNHKLLNTNVYRDYFWNLFKHKYDEIWTSTDADGSTTMQPVSWDYRFSNLCNFKCRTCGDMLSSAWESEQRQHNMIDWSNPKNSWMEPHTRQQISQFQDQQIEQEFAEAVEQHRIEEIYWVGGEPLMYEQHWRYMKRIIQLADGPKLYARYNTNLSRVDYQGTNLFTDILAHVRDWQICASLDGTGSTGQYIRTGLDYDQWLRNFEQGRKLQTNPRQMRIDFTLTLPGLTEVMAMEDLASQLQVDLLVKTIFSFSPEIIMSPLALPRHLLERTIRPLVFLTSGAMQDVLVQLLNRPTFEEQWPDQWQTALAAGKRRILRLEQIRGDTYTMDSILSKEPLLYGWWKNIRTD